MYILAPSSAVLQATIARNRLLLTKETFPANVVYLPKDTVKRSFTPDRSCRARSEILICGDIALTPSAMCCLEKFSLWLPQSKEPVWPKAEVIDWHFVPVERRPLLQSRPMQHEELRQALPRYAPTPAETDELDRYYV